MSLDASSLRWSRLAACLGLSILLHAAIIARMPVPAQAPAAETLLVRLAASSVPPEPVPAPPNETAPRVEDRPMISSKSRLARRVPVAPAPRPRSSALQAGAPTPLSSSYESYGDLRPGVEEEKLTQAQRRIPRGNRFEVQPQPLRPIVPRYPEAQLSARVRGQVLVEAFISAGGAVEDAVVLDDEGKPQFAAAALEALHGASFRPAEGPQGPSRSRVTLRFLFTFE